MRAATVQRILGLMLALFSASMLPPVAVSLIYHDGLAVVFTEAFAWLFIVGWLLWFPVRKRRQELRVRDGFMVVVLFWVTVCLSGALPFMLADSIDMDFTDSVFESVSGLTTTGATVIDHIDALPESILYYRQQLQWLGGMGIVVLAVAILPMLGIGGMQLYRAETPGPVKDSKLTPRITETAKALWVIYLMLTVACTLGYWLAGMPFFDALGHSYSTVATGGFSTHDASIGYYDDPWIESVGTLFMFLAGMNFSLHFVAWRHRSVSGYFQDPEWRAFVAFTLGVSAVCVFYLWLEGMHDHPARSISHALFQAVSFGTATGLASDDYVNWPSILPMVLVLASFAGACGGSTGGGLKTIRFVLLLRQGMREIRALIHPSAVLPVKLGGRVVPEKVISAVWGFFGLYVLTFTLIMLIFAATGLDQVSAFAATAASINNLGLGLGEVASGFGSLTDVAKWTACLGMLLGRLELFTLLVLLTPAYWRR